MKLASLLILVPLSVGCAAESTSTAENAEEALAAASPFVCPNAANTTLVDTPSASTKPAILVSARAAGHPAKGIDRFVLEFARNGAAPSFNVIARNSATFHDTADRPHALAGNKGLLVVVHGATAGWPIEENIPEYQGPKSLSPGDTTVLKQAQYIEDFEATLLWGLGVEKASCVRAYRLTDPPRVVVDIQR